MTTACMQWLHQVSRLLKPSVNINRAMVASPYSTALTSMPGKFAWISPEIETVGIRLKHQWNSFSSGLLLICMYRPPRYPWKDAREKVNIMLKKMGSFSDPVVITGDMNIHFDNPSDLDFSCRSNAGIRNQLYQHVTDATHVGGHTVDVVVTNSRANIWHRRAATIPVRSVWFCGPINHQQQHHQKYELLVLWNWKLFKFFNLQSRQ